MTIPGEIWGLAASLCWAIGPLFALGPVRKLGTLGFAALRMLFSSLILALIALFSVDTLGGDGRAWLFLAASSFAGILVGDTLIFYALRTVGPRIASVLYAMNAPFTAILAYLAFAEVLAPLQVLGVSLCFAGVVVAVVARDDPKSSGNGPRRGRTGTVDESAAAEARARAWGIAAGVGAAFAQAAGVLLAKPALEAGMDPIGAAALRVAFSAVLINILAALAGTSFLVGAKLSRADLAGTAASALIANGGGMIFIMMAVATARSLGLASALASLAPVMVLPALWLMTRRAPAPLAWIGAATAVGGVAVIFNI